MKNALLLAVLVGLAVTALAQTTSEATISAAENYTQSLITQPLDEKQLTVLKGNTHPLARPQFDVGTAPPDLPMQRMLLVLKRSPQQEAALRSLLDAQQDKSSPHYHKWLTPDEFGKQFGPSDQDIQVITSWLQSHGFQISRVTAGRTVIEFSGVEAQVEQSFHTPIHKYVANGEEHWANAIDPQIPAALAPVVAGVVSLHNFRKKTMHRFNGVYSKSSTTGQVTPLQPQFTFPGHCNPDGNCYVVTPYDFATIYNVLPLWNKGIDGTGQTIAIVGRTNINIHDAQDFRNLFGLPVNDPKVILNGPDPGITDPTNEAEADIDVQWSGAVAKNATIDLVVSESTETTDGVDLSAQYIIDNNLAPVMSESFGLCELGLGTSGNLFQNALWEQASAQGITVFVPSGDNGAAGCDSETGAAQFGLAVNGLASTPFNVAVGGTDFKEFTNAQTYWNVTNNAHQASAKGYIPETTWNSSCTNALFGTMPGGSTNPETNCNNPNQPFSVFVDSLGGSGGASSCTTSDGQHVSSCSVPYPKPAWQTGTGVPKDGKRDVPDVSLFASNGFVGSFYFVCQSDSTGGTCSMSAFAGFGGTSVSSPSFAGIMGLVDQNNGSRQGNANYVFYKLAAQQPASSCNSSTGPASNCVFNDVTAGTIAVPCLRGSPNCTTNNPNDRFGVLTGQSTGTGYDLATGLGSVNVTNLVNNWSSVTNTFKSSTTTLTLNSGNPVNITHGQPVSVTVNVSPASATGGVSLVGGPNNSALGIDAHVLSTGTASWTTNLLPGGQNYLVTAQYSGDGTYSASASTAVAVTVNPENSSTLIHFETFSPGGNLISSNATSAAYGSTYILRVDVANSAGKTCAPFPVIQAGCPSGTVNLTDNGSPLGGGAFTLNNLGFLEDRFIQLPVGSHTVQASYSGDNSYNKGSPASAPFTVTQAGTTTTLQSSSSNVTSGTNVTLTATIVTNSRGSAPSGMVTFFSGTTPVGSPVQVTGTAGGTNPQTGAFQPAQATATFSTTQLPLGKNSITAQYTGDSNYSGSTSSASVVTVTNFTLAFNSSSLTIASPGQSGNIVLTITGQSGYKGTLNFAPSSCSGLPSESTCSFAPASVTGSGTTTVTITTIAPQVGALPLAPILDWSATSAGFTLAGVFVLGTPSRRRRWSKILSLVVLAFLLAVVGCGGHSGPPPNPGTPLGSSLVTVTGTAGGIAQTAQFTLLVQ